MPSDLARCNGLPQGRLPYMSFGNPTRQKITGGTRPPWQEHLIPHWEWDEGQGMLMPSPPQNGPLAPHPDRPRMWFEIVRDGRVLLRSQRPLAVLRTVCRLDLGERIYAARRKTTGSSVLGVYRYLVYGPPEES